MVYNDTLKDDLTDNMNLSVKQIKRAIANCLKGRHLTAKNNLDIIVKTIENYNCIINNIKKIQNGQFKIEAIIPYLYRENKLFEIDNIMDDKEYEEFNNAFNLSKNCTSFNLNQINYDFEIEIYIYPDFTKFSINADFVSAEPLNIPEFVEMG